MRLQSVRRFVPPEAQIQLPPLSDTLVTFVLIVACSLLLSPSLASMTWQACGAAAASWRPLSPLTCLWPDGAPPAVQPMTVFTSETSSYAAAVLYSQWDTQNHAGVNLNHQFHLVPAGEFGG